MQENIRNRYFSVQSLQCDHKCSKSQASRLYMKCSVIDTRCLYTVDVYILLNLNNLLDPILNWIPFILFLLSICFSPSLKLFLLSVTIIFQPLKILQFWSIDLELRPNAAVVTIFKKIRIAFFYIKIGKLIGLSS